MGRSPVRGSLWLCSVELASLLPQLANVLVVSIDVSDAAVTVRARTRSGVPAECPGRGEPSSWIHSRYIRRLADITLGGRPLHIHLSVRRLYCENPACPKVTFTEQVAGLTVRYQRRTPELQRLVEAVGVVLAGRGGSRMLRILNVTLSRCTVLSQLMRMPLPPLETPRVLGVDDFALYGDTYGTLLVDATTRLPLTLWEGRDAHSSASGSAITPVSRWLAATARSPTGRASPLVPLTQCRSATVSISGRGSPAASRTSPPRTAAACPQRCPPSARSIQDRSRRLPRTPRKPPEPGAMPEGCSRPCTL